VTGEAASTPTSDGASGGRPTRIAVYTAEVLGDRMAGPGIRAFRMAEALAQTHEVRLISEVRADLSHDRFTILRAGGDELVRNAAWADVFITQSPVLGLLPQLLDTDTLIVADLYDPFLFEELQQLVYLDPEGEPTSSERTVTQLNDTLRYADFFLCASERQRDLWIGHLVALGRVNELTYRRDPSLRDLIDVVPFGIDDVAPEQRAHRIRGSINGIGEHDKVVIWGGGIYDWFDPLTLIRAVHQLSRRRDDLRLFFLAMTHPNPAVAPNRMSRDALQLATDLGALGRSVFFNEEWVRHEDRADYLLDADVGVSTHLDNLETSYSFRTRLLDYLWAALPIVNTAGDAFERPIVERGLGTIVPPLDQQAIADALERLLYGAPRPVNGNDLRRYARELEWGAVLEPLLRFCNEPTPAADSARLAARRAEAVLTGELVATANGRDAARVAALEARVRELEASASWRLTAPLRWTKDVMRKVVSLQRR
jgi:glycosyltransferase involved in cell wall biosynthesis